MARKQNTQTIAWFWDQYKRGLLNLNPPYQRLSVWNQPYKEFFIDTVLLNFPAPAIFLHEVIKATGVSEYAVVDGKQRLLSIFEFLSDTYPAGERTKLQELRGRYFSTLPDEVKAAFYSYSFTVEYLPNTEAELLNDVFDRINRNVVKLTPQELRHARFDGAFIKAAERLAEWLKEFSPDMPRITTSARNQMKDVEFVANLLLFLEEGPTSYSTVELDQAFADRDAAWDNEVATEENFRRVANTINDLLNAPGGQALRGSRLRNQADYYSFFGAINELLQSGVIIEAGVWVERLSAFMDLVESEQERETNARAQEYYSAARSASNDPGARSTRIRIIRQVIQGALQ
jgi:hypothetical protein